MTHVVLYSGGVAAYFAARRVVDRHGSRSVTLLFADTGIEDPDLYRFLKDTTGSLGATLVTLRSGMTPWTVFEREKAYKDGRGPTCSYMLKRKPLREFVDAHYRPEDTTLYAGFDWTEEDALRSFAQAWAPWTIEAPLLEKPYLSRQQMVWYLTQASILPPRMALHGFPHTNCGGFCVKAGEAQFAKLLHTGPNVYADAEKREAAMQPVLGTVLEGQSLQALRERLEADPRAFAVDDWGGCGCMLGISR